MIVTTIKLGNFLNRDGNSSNMKICLPNLIEAFVAAEDGSFFSHKGLNYRAILRAFIVNFKEGKKVQGGSTITQQLARTLLLSSKKTYTRKLKEAILALRMESTFSKQDILYIYLNQIYMGHGAYGVEMASRIYFRKSIKDISLAEAALLAGLPKAPSRFSPIHNPIRAKIRQMYVLKRMYEEGYIEKETLKQTLNLPLKIYTREDFNSQSPYYLETVRRLLLKKFNQKELLEGGLRVFTAMDLNLQKAAKRALTKGLEEVDKRQGYRGKPVFVEESNQQEFIEKTAAGLKKKLKKYFVMPGGLPKDDLTAFLSNLSDSDSTEPSKNPEDPTEEQKNSADASLKQTKELFKNQAQKEETPFPWEEYREALEGKIFKGILKEVKQEDIKVLTPWGVETLFLEDLSWAVPIEEKKEKKLLRT